MRSKKSAARALSCIAVLVAGALRAHAQDTPTKHVVFTERAAYVAGLPAVISGADADIYPDPRGRFAIVSHSVASPRQDAFVAPFADASDALSSNLILYDSHNGRTKVVWRSDTGRESSGVVDVTWLAGADAALCVVYEPSTMLQTQSGKSRTSSSLLYVRPTATGLISRVIYTDTGLLSIRASPTLPFALISAGQPSQDSEENISFAYKRFTVDERGTVSAPIALGPQSTGGYTWSADGTTTYFRDSLASPPAPIDSASPVAPQLSMAPKKQWYSFNIQTSILTPVADQPPYDPAAKPKNKNVLRLVSGALTAAPPGSGDAQPTANASKLTPLWLVRADRKHEGHLPTAALIAPDAGQSFLLADDSAILFIAEHSVYAVSLTLQRRPDVDTAYRKLLQHDTMSQAKEIGLALIGFTQDNDEKFPDAGNLAKSMAAYLGDVSLFNNPETDQPGFTLSLAGQSQSSIADSAHTILGYLAGPGGRAVLMADGHVHWEDSP